MSPHLESSADAYALRPAEGSPLSCTILGNIVGFVKIAATLILVPMTYFEWKRRPGAGEFVIAWPTIFFSFDSVSSCYMQSIIDRNMLAFFGVTCASTGTQQSPSGSTPSTASADYLLPLP